MKHELFNNGSAYKAPAESPASPLAAPRIRASRTRESLTKATPNGTSSPGAKPRPRAAAAAAAADAAAGAPALEFNGTNGRKPVSRRLEPSFRDASEDLQRRLEASEGLVRELKSEVVRLQAELQRVQDHYCDVEAQKRKMEVDLSAAQERINILERKSQTVVLQEAQQHQLERVNHGSIQSQLEKQLKLLKNSGKDCDVNTKLEKSEDKAVKTSSAKVPALPSMIQSRASAVAGPPMPPPPPPPPPPVRLGQPRTSSMNKAVELVELYNSLTKRDAKRASAVSPSTVSPHHGIVGELQNRSSHLLAIKSDVETRGDFINHLIVRVQSAAYSDMEGVLYFVDWLDQQLSSLSDETAVLKHFNWPERKADALREAAIEYRDLKRLQDEISSFREENNSLSFESTLRKMTALLEKLEKAMDRLAKLRSSAMPAYKEFKIPTEWMLESGLAAKMKLASIQLAKICMNRVLTEIDTAKSSEKETAHEALVAHSVRFAYRVHQLAGGLDSEAMCAFDKLRDRVRR